MPHITIKNLDSNLTDWSEADFQAFADDLAAFIAQRFQTREAFISADYIKVPQEKWMNDIFEKEIRPKAQTLIRKPGYGLQK